MSGKIILFFLLAGVSCPVGLAFAQIQPSVSQSAPDLTQMSLADLMNVQVYSASKMPEKFFNTAAAIYVITPEDIRRSGANNIPDLLRMVPGLNVQQVNSHTWNISARGFTGGVFANKLLVLIDGRSVYTPLYGGVFWELNDVMLEDIDRIEVIRGPGGTLWGANAVNGVINIITKKASDTQGGLVSVGAGSYDKDFSSLRYGTKSGDWSYRAYGKYLDRGEGYLANGTANDTWQEGRTGFRADNKNWTVQGDYYQEFLGQQAVLDTLDPPYRIATDKTSYAQGGNLLTRYETQDWSLQTYWEGTNENFQIFKELRNIFDTEYNQHAAITENQVLNWGLGYRLNLEDVTDSSEVKINKPQNTDQVFNLFLQDEIQLNDKLKLTIGSKLEHNIYTHFEVEPNVRLAYDINDTNMVWTAASRAVRTPSRLEVDGDILSSVSNVSPVFVAETGNRDLSSERLDSYELGYRTQPRENLFFDFAGFVNHYDRLITYDYQGSSVVDGDYIYLYQTVNGQEGDAYGIELSSEWKVTDWWKIKTAYTYTQLTIADDPGIDATGFQTLLEDAVPRHNIYVRSSFDLSHGYELDATARYSDQFQGGEVPSNTEVDINLEKTINQWQIAIVGENLLKPHHLESAIGTISPVTQVPRSAYVKVTYKF